MKTILHPTDFTANSEQIFRMLCPIARQESAEIIVLHVISPEICPPEDRDGDEVKKDSFLYQSCLGRFIHLRDIADGITTKFELKVGHPVETIAAAARSQNCDLIALAATHHTYLHYNLKGSIADSLIRLCPVPVLCLRQSPFHQDSVVIAAESQSETISVQSSPPESAGCCAVAHC